jgi:ribosome-associated toxin RatA of RatAB toxin-antitoxin module
MKAGLTTGLELMEQGNGKLLVSDGSKTLKLATAAGDDGATKVYICNNATDDTYYIDVDIHDQRLGRLYAGDWLFMPWSQTDTDAALVIEAEGGTCPYEYAIFKEGETLVAGA